MNDVIRDYTNKYYDRVKVQANVYIKHDKLKDLLDSLKNDKEISDFLSVILNDLVSGKLVRVSDLINNGFMIIPVNDNAKASSINSYIQEIYEQNETVKAFSYNMMTLLQTMNTLINNMSMFGMLGMLQPQANWGFPNIISNLQPQFMQNISNIQQSVLNQQVMTPQTKYEETQNKEVVSNITEGAIKINEQFNNNIEEIKQNNVKINGDESYNNEDFTDLEEAYNEVNTEKSTEEDDDNYLELQKTLSLTENLMPDF